jgi:transposase InsO family protein
MRKILHDLARVFLVEFIILLVLAVLVIVGYLYRKPLLISYHRLGQQSAMKAMRRAAMPEMQRERYQHYSDRYQRHTDALIRLGYLEERRFQPKFLTPRSPQTQAMIEEFFRIHPRSSYDMGWGKTLTITDHPERMPTWESLLRKYDVPPSDPNQPSAPNDLMKTEVP